MTYLIFDKDDELIDIINFENTTELEKFKIANPNLTLRNEDDIVFLEEDEFFGYDDEEDYEEW